MIVVIGEVLFDEFPEYKQIGGAPFNVAFHLRHLGMPCRFVSRVGDDEEGEEILDWLKEMDFETDFIQIDDQHPTGKVLIEADSLKNPEYEILPDMACDHIEYDPAILEAGANDAVDLVNFGTLIQRTDEGLDTLQRLLLQKDRYTRCLYDVNLRPGNYNERIIQESLAHSDVVKLTEDELNLIRRLLIFTRNRHHFIDFLMDEYPLEMICLTRGPKGSELFTPEGHYTSGPSEPSRVEDTVGAGDAYTAILSIGYIQKWPAPKILETASRFAGKILGIKGAIPSKTTFYGDIKREIKAIGDQRG